MYHTVFLDIPDEPPSTPVSGTLLSSSGPSRLILPNPFQSFCTLPVKMIRLFYFIEKAKNKQTVCLLIWKILLICLLISTNFARLFAYLFAYFGNLAYFSVCLLFTCLLIFSIFRQILLIRSVPAPPAPIWHGCLFHFY